MRNIRYHLTPYMEQDDTKDAAEWCYCCMYVMQLNLSFLLKFAQLSWNCDLLWYHHDQSTAGGVL